MFPGVVGFREDFGSVDCHWPNLTVLKFAGDNLGKNAATPSETDAETFFQMVLLDVPCRTSTSGVVAAAMREGSLAKGPDYGARGLLGGGNRRVTTGLGVWGVE